MRSYRRIVTQYLIALLGFLLFAVSLEHAIFDSENALTNLLEITAPLGVGVIVFISGLWLTRTHSTSRVRRLALWALGGAVVGTAINVWFWFIISLERVPPGDPVLLNLNGVAITIAAGLLLGYYVTGLEEREQALERSEARFRALTENASFAVVAIDETGQIRYTNDAVADLFGYIPTELEGEPLTKLMPGALREEHQDGLAWYLSDGTPAVDWDGLELRGLQANGDEFPIEVNFGEYAVDSEHLFTGVIRDISSRKETESQLQDHTSKVTELHELATEIITAETTDAIYERTVTGAVDLFDADIARVAVATGDQLEPAASSAPGDSVRDCDPISIPVGFAGQSYQSNAVLRVDDVADTRSATTSLSQNGGAQPYPQPEPRALLNIPLAAYGVLQVYATEPNAFAERDEEVGEMLATHVVTALERVSAEATIRRERDRLEEFASILSHDLRNPLNVAHGRLELLDYSDGNEHLDVIEQALTRMERLIEDMLTLARQGDAVGETEPLSLEEVATRAWGNVATDAATLETEGDQQLDADRNRLIQVLENLYRNAIEHGGTDVTVRVGTLDDGFYIEDTGPGIPPDERNAVFESGYTTAQEGTGFGLAIVKRIVEAHEWEIDVTAGRSGGTRLEITGV